jgi:hypothetical protein
MSAPQRSASTASALIMPCSPCFLRRFIFLGDDCGWVNFCSTRSALRQNRD